MASSPSIHRCLSLDSTSNVQCSVNNEADDGIESESETKKSKYKFCKNHVLFKKHIHRHFVFHPQKLNRRRYTFSGCHEQKIFCKKRRRFTSIALPTKFLLGGNINDPLNLRSLEDETEQFGSFTPASSPLPIPRGKAQVQVMIPPNIYDPLNLCTGEEIDFNLLNSKSRKRRRHRKNKREESENGNSNLQALPANIEYCYESKVNSESVSIQNHSHSKYSESQDSSSAEERIIVDKIVSPVVPQGSPAKFLKRYHSRSFSKEFDDKVHKPSVKRRRSKTRLQQNLDSIKFRANAEKFCYGNHVSRSVCWDSNRVEFDVRLQILNRDMFRGKDIVDIGCNTGELTLYIARHCNPHKIIGIDIDKKLINIAERKVRKHKSKMFSENINFPKGMASMYGSIAKLGVVSLNSVFPNNVAFFEANYVPVCEEYLESQKQEFDIVLCLRVTKWIHLNFGDDGLKLAFRRMFAQLRIGGCLILEPQPWFTYSASKRITPSIYNTYRSLKLKPEAFCSFLVSEVGFSSCQLIGRIYNATKVYRQPVYLLTKGYQNTSSQNIQTDNLSSMLNLNVQWNQNVNEQDGDRSWMNSGYLPRFNSLS